MTTNNWHPYENGETIGQQGFFRRGKIIQDDVHPDGTRIQLEQDNDMGYGFVIYCEINGWMQHTRFFVTERKALEEYRRMQGALIETIRCIDNSDKPNDAILDFWKDFPTYDSFLEKTPMTYTYETILVETPAPGVGLVRLNRPQALNALNSQLTAELFTALEAFELDADIKCMILTGSDKAFAAGADIKQMENTDAVTMFAGQDFTDWTRLTRLRKPLIGAVSGWALGGGCEMAMMCDMLIVSETAKFGQPEIGIGIMPGAGGTQRLTRAVGKTLAMEICLTDRRLTAQEALHYGLVNAVYPVETYLAETVKLAEKIATMPGVAVKMIKDAINRSFELSLTESLNYEKRNFYLLFGTEDKAEGMKAFVDKRKAEWKNR